MSRDIAVEFRKCLGALKNHQLVLIINPANITNIGCAASREQARVRASVTSIQGRSGPEGSAPPAGERRTEFRE